MKIKVCGMRNPHNIASLAKLPIHFMGFIFYPPSRRYVADMDAHILDCLPTTISRVGVFVDAEVDYVRQKTKEYKLDFTQLHGKETVAYCSLLKHVVGKPIIKAFNVAQATDFEQTEAYQLVCDYFLFDTKTALHGGSGLKFDWHILQAYTGTTPFFLSGGIAPDDVAAIQEIKHPLLYALDLNSKFELSPAMKDIDAIAQFANRINETNKTLE